MKYKKTRGLKEKSAVSGTLGGSEKPTTVPDASEFMMEDRMKKKKKKRRPKRLKMDLPF
jgi:hypothetical protein